MSIANDYRFGTQIRKSPYFDATVRWGATEFSVYNHMVIPRNFGDPVQNFWNLVNDAILCDVAVERQVEVTGPDAAQFAQLMTPRDLSAMADMDLNTNPYELGLDRLVSPDMDAEFFGKAALRRIRENGVTRKLVGLRIDCEPLKGPNTRFWPINDDSEQVGRVTSAVHSPRLEQNIALAMVSADRPEIGTKLSVSTPWGPAPATVVPKPFFDPQKKIAAAADSPPRLDDNLKTS